MVYYSKRRIRNNENGCLIVKIRVDISSCFKSFDDSREMRGFNYGFLIILIGIRTIKRKKEKKRILLYALKILPRNEAR